MGCGHRGKGASNADDGLIGEHSTRRPSILHRIKQSSIKESVKGCRFYYPNLGRVGFISLLGTQWIG